MQPGQVPLKIAAQAVSYRVPMAVMGKLLLINGESYPICPRCDSSFDREYTRFCDRCGQRLSWGLYTFAACRKAGEK